MKKCLNLSFLSMLFLFQFLFTGCSSDVGFSQAELGKTGEPQPINKTVQQSFTQGLVINKLDVLVVVDNSWSMAEEQQKMGEKMNSFLSTLSDVNWQLGVTTTDVSNGIYGIKGSLLKLVGLGHTTLNKNVGNYQNIFKNTILRPESFNCTDEFNCASGDEQPLRALIMAMEKRNGDNAGFFRPDADLGVIVLSDEDEMSIGGTNATQAAEVLTTFNNIWGDTKKIYAYGMIIRPGDTACMDVQKATGGNYGTAVDGLVRATGGLTGSICANDYGPTLGRLAQDVRRLLDYVQLDFLPINESVKIEFTPAHKTDFRVDGRRIYFAEPPPKDTLIKVSYTAK